LARQLLQEESWSAAGKILLELVERDGEDPRLHELLGEALLGLDETDAAAERFDIALRLLGPGADPKALKRIERSLQRADPLQGRRSKLRRDATSRLYSAAKRLFELGHSERALEALLPLHAIAQGKDAAKSESLLAEIEASSEEVDLDEASREPVDGEVWPLLEYESEHYRLEANLELEVIERVAATMDDIHGYYVDLYLDGNEKAVSGSKATIRIHPSRESMLQDWTGANPVEGWWSPGQNRVTCYDTRRRTGDLDGMLRTLFHEASHQFMTQLERKGGNAPAWLNEGTASFFEGARAMADRRVLWPDAALMRLNSLLAMLSGRVDGPSLEDVLEFGGPGSYPGKYYPWGWGIVYFMQQFEDPGTLEHIFRPLYSTYRERITSRGGESMGLFEEVFLGAASPLGHLTLADFEETWRAWIVDEVAPLHLAPVAERRKRRRELVERYTEAAERARAERKPRVSPTELLTRALGHLEYIRKQIDGEDHDDVELIALQAEILVELGRPKAAAALVERLLQLADREDWAATPEEIEELEQQLKRLDRGNWAQRRLVSSRRALARRCRALLERYLESDPPQRRRALSLASRFARGLGGEAQLTALAEDLRSWLREKRQLIGIPHGLHAPKRDWSTTYSEAPQSFQTGEDFIDLRSVRPHGRIQTRLRLGAEYLLRTTLVREGDLFRSTTQGLVIAATEDSDWLVLGLQKSGRAGLWKLSRTTGGGVNTRKLKSLALNVPPPDEGRIRIRVHVLVGQWIRLRVGEAEELEVPYPPGFEAARYVGLYVKDGSTRLEDSLVELFD